MHLSRKNLHSQGVSKIRLLLFSEFSQWEVFEQAIKDLKNEKRAIWELQDLQPLPPSMQVGVQLCTNELTTQWEIRTFLQSLNEVNK